MRAEGSAKFLNGKGKVRPAMKSKATHRLWFVVLAVLGLAADQASKYGVFAWLRETPGYDYAVISDVFHLNAFHYQDEEGQLTPHVNKGALFGWMSNLGVQANTGFAVVSLLAALAISIWVIQRSAAEDRWLCMALGLILAGTLGNFYDRVVFGGVRDFLHWKYPEWPVFNVADCCLVIGAGILLLQAFKAPAPATANTTTLSDAHSEPVATTRP